MPLVDEMAEVQLIRERREDKWSLGMIADAFNRDRVPTKQGGKWYARTIKNVLENSLYRKTSDALVDSGFGNEQHSVIKAAV